MAATTATSHFDTADRLTVAASFIAGASRSLAWANDLTGTSTAASRASRRTARRVYGVIDANQARDLRLALTKESQLYGAMDGAMKFVKGDVIAGIVIAVINIIGGLIIGVAMHEISEIMGRIALEGTALNGAPDYAPYDLFRYTAPALSANGVTGSPSLATESLGRRLFDAAVAAIASRVERGRVEKPPLGVAPFPSLSA